MRPEFDKFLSDSTSIRHLMEVKRRESCTLQILKKLKISTSDKFNSEKAVRERPCCIYNKGVVSNSQGRIKKKKRRPTIFDVWGLGFRSNPSIISQDAKYGVIEVSLGLFPSSGATQRLPRLVGLSKAKEIVLTGDYIEPKEAKECGLVHEVVDDREKTDKRAREWADKLAKNAPLGMQHARRLLNSAFDMPLDEGLDLETVLGEKLINTHDYEEGFTARIEGREPKFKGE